MNKQFQPVFTPWRHGGWYVVNVRYPNGACGCVSNNYEDKKWRIVCDERDGDHTYKTREAAAIAEYEIASASHNAVKERCNLRTGLDGDFSNQ